MLKFLIFNFLKSSTKEVDTHEYDSKVVAGVKKVDKKNSSNFYDFNEFRLAVAIAKCTFTKKPDSKYLLSESLINILRIETLVSKSKNKTLLLNQNRIDLIRDFSKTTRIGELAQGIAFMFAQDKLHIPTPFDFDGYLLSKFNVITNDSTPDFIGVSRQGTYDLVESKGSLETRKNIIKSRLNIALKQCDEGENFLNTLKLPNAKRKFGILTLFEFDPPRYTKNSAIHFCDPDSNPEFLFNSWQLIVSYYKAIFYGFLDINLLEIRAINKLKEVEYKNHKFKFFNLNGSGREHFRSNYVGLFPRHIQIGISSKILELITSKKINEEEYFKTIHQLSELRSTEKYASESDLVYEVFSDGTIFKFKR